MNTRTHIAHQILSRCLDPMVHDNAETTKNDKKLQDLGRVCFATPQDGLGLAHAIMPQLKDRKLTGDYLVDMAIAQAEAEPRKYLDNLKESEFLNRLESFKTSMILDGFSTKTILTLLSDTIKQPIYVMKAGEITSYPPQAGHPEKEDSNS